MAGVGIWLGRRAGGLGRLVSCTGLWLVDQVGPKLVDDVWLGGLGTVGGLGLCSGLWLARRAGGLVRLVSCTCLWLVGRGGPELVADVW